MSLYINSPAYFTRQHGIDEEVYKLCSAISKAIDISQYTECLDTVGITPIIAPKHLIDAGVWKEERRVSTASRMASISLCIDYEAYLNGNSGQRSAIILEHILYSLQVVKKRLKDQLEYERLARDIILISENHIKCSGKEIYEYL